jgi:hypothetical protein
MSGATPAELAAMQAGHQFTLYLQDSPADVSPLSVRTESIQLWYVPDADSGKFYWGPSDTPRLPHADRVIQLKLLTDVFVGTEKKERRKRKTEKNKRTGQKRPTQAERRHSSQLLISALSSPAWISFLCRQANTYFPFSFLFFCS